jgi:hypothetical protein
MQEICQGINYAPIGLGRKLYGLFRERGLCVEGPDGKGGIKASPICFICNHGGEKLSESLTVHSGG